MVAQFKANEHVTDKRLSPMGCHHWKHMHQDPSSVTRMWYLGEHPNITFNWDDVTLVLCPLQYQISQKQSQHYWANLAHQAYYRMQAVSFEFFLLHKIISHIVQQSLSR
jgi:hypothetical protein